jgi:hypothetical protein
MKYDLSEPRRVTEAGEYTRDGQDFLYSADNHGFLTIVGIGLPGKRSARIGGSVAGTLDILAGEIIGEGDAG